VVVSEIELQIDTALKVGPGGNAAQRLLGTIRDRLAQGASIERAALGVAAWMRYVTGIDERGQQIDVRDPLAERLRAIADAAENAPPKLTDGFLNVREVFGGDLPRNEQLRSLLTDHLASLFRYGTRATVRNAVRRPDIGE
jgi:fructuronate reductase